MSEKKSLHRFFSIPLNKVNSAKSDSDFAAQQTVPKIIWHQRYNKHRFTPPNGTSHFCKAEIVPFLYNSEIITNSEHGRTLFAPTVIWASPTSAKSLRSLRIYIALRARKAVQILYSDITFIWYLTSIYFWYYNLHLVGLRRMRLCLILR